MTEPLKSWRVEWSAPQIRARWILSLLVLAIALAIWQQFLGWVEQRPGVRLHDPVLASFEPIDLTYPSFVLVYGGLLAAIVLLLKNPRGFRVAALAYGLMVLIRTVMMYVTPLDPPEKMILLQDPFVALAGVQKTPTRDLFFSGHTATLALFSFVFETRARWFFALAAAAMAVMVLLQQVHYTIDVLVAPFIAFCAFRISEKIHR